MNWKSNRCRTEKLFTEAELVLALVELRDAKLGELPTHEEYKHDFSVAFEQKMQKLFALEKRMRVMKEVRRWVAAFFLVVIMGAGTLLTVDIEVRAAFIEWMRSIYENSVFYEFFNEPTKEELPTYQLGWVPEGYDSVEIYRNEGLYSAIYRNTENEGGAFLFEYRYGHSGMQVELYGDLSRYEVKQANIEGVMIDLYLSQNPLESSVAMWVDEKTGIVFKLNGMLEEIVILNIIETVELVK